jgi:SAM-dependent methyltransferase
VLTLQQLPKPARLAIKRALFPGLDLHTRCRYRYLPRFFRSGLIDTLDAGCGNGALAYAAYKLENRVLGVTFSTNEVRRNQEFFEGLLGNDDRLRFDQLNLYELPKLGRTFDQIVCSETLEHITHDDEVVGHFSELLNPGGVLHLCCPFALHPDNNLGRVSGPEDGGHVRDGYTLDGYRRLLGKAGLDIVAVAGLGSPLLVALEKRVNSVRARYGDAAALPLFYMLLPITLLDRLNPRVPLSLYVQAVKPAERGVPRSSRTHLEEFGVP